MLTGDVISSPLPLYLAGLVFFFEKKFPEKEIFSFAFYLFTLFTL